MSEVLPEGGASNAPSQVGRDMEVSQNTQAILWLKQRVREELEGPGFPDLEFLFASENTQTLSDVFDDLLREEENRLESLYTKEKGDISYEDIPDFITLECLHNFSYHILNVRRTEQRGDSLPSISQKFEKFKDTFYRSRELYDIICFLLQRDDLSQDQKRVLELQKSKCEKYGVHLDDAIKERLRPIQERLSNLATAFMKNISTFRNETQFVLEEYQLGNMPENLRNMAKKEAEEQGIEGYIFIFTPANQDALLKYSSDVQIRREVYFTSLKIAAEENDDIVLEMLELRKKYAKELGFDSYADYALQGNMALSKEEIDEIYRKKLKNIGKYLK